LLFTRISFAQKTLFVAVLNNYYLFEIWQHQFALSIV
jgi:hypothetical protein